MLRNCAEDIYARRVLNFVDVHNVRNIFALKSVDKNKPDLNLVGLVVVQAWLKVGKTYLTNFECVETTSEITAEMLLSQWDTMTVEQCDWTLSSALRRYD